MAVNTKGAAAAERKAAGGNKTNDQKMVEALLTERQGYVTRGDKGRIALVDKQIKAYGGTPPKGGAAASANDGDSTLANADSGDDKKLPADPETPNGAEKKA